MGRSTYRPMETIEPPARGRGRGRLLVVLALALAPFLFEGTLVCVGRWRAMFGPVPAVATPAFDLVGAGWRGLVAWVLGLRVPGLRRAPWQASYVMVVGALWALVCALLLRHRR